MNQSKFNITVSNAEARIIRERQAAKICEKKKAKGELKRRCEDVALARELGINVEDLK